MGDVVTIRHFNPESDAKQVHDIWINGLEQTVESKNWLLRPFWKLLFYLMARNAVRSNGDVGPSGQNLFKHWCQDNQNRCLLVAEKDVTRKDETPNAIVGCIAIIRGTNCKVNAIVNREDVTFSVWKMSVAGDFRRQGVGRKLIMAGEKWAVENGCKTMKMVTANPVASRFYQNQGYKTIHPSFFFGWLGSWYEKQICPLGTVHVHKRNVSELSMK